MARRDRAATSVHSLVIEIYLKTSMLHLHVVFVPSDNCTSNNEIPGTVFIHGYFLV